MADELKDIAVTGGAGSFFGSMVGAVARAALMKPMSSLEASTLLTWSGIGALLGGLFGAVFEISRLV